MEDIRELSTVLAALRFYQAALDEPGHGQGIPSGIRDIADNLGQVEPLTADEIDELCEKLNFGED